MFAHMVSELKTGNLPDTNLLRRRFEAALVKKLAVIRTPSSFWTADSKINPPAKHLLWAAILLQDKENCKMIEAVITSELEEKQRAKGQPVSMQELTARVQQLVQEYLREFVESAPNEIFKENLRQEVAELFPENLAKKSELPSF